MKLGELYDLLKEMSALDKAVNKEEWRAFDPSESREKLNKLRAIILETDMSDICGATIPLKKDTP